MFHGLPGINVEMPPVLYPAPLPQYDAVPVTKAEPAQDIPARRKTPAVCWRPFCLKATETPCNYCLACKMGTRESVALQSCALLRSSPNRIKSERLAGKRRKPEKRGRRMTAQRRVRTRSRVPGLSGTERVEDRHEGSSRLSGLRLLPDLICPSRQEQTPSSTPPGRKGVLTQSFLILKEEWRPNSGLSQSNWL